MKIKYILATLALTMVIGTIVLGKIVQIEDKIDGVWYGSPKDNVSIAIIREDRMSYVGFRRKGSAALDLALCLQDDGKSYIQVSDPETQKLFFVDLLKLAKEQGEKQ